MAFLDILSTSFLFSIAIIILIGGIFAYVNFRMGEQDHKLNSMIGLVSSMAGESQYFRSKLNASYHCLYEGIQTSSRYDISKLITSNKKRKKKK